MSKVSDIAIIGALIAGGYLLYNVIKGSPSANNDPTCQNLSGFPRTLCELGGYLLGNPNAPKPPDTPATCAAAHAHIVGDHCECDGGYHPSADKQTCVPNATGCQAFDQWKADHPTQCWEVGVWGNDGCPTGWHEVPCSQPIVPVAPIDPNNMQNEDLNPSFTISSGQFARSGPYAGLPCREKLGSCGYPIPSSGLATNCTDTQGWDREGTILYHVWADPNWRCGVRSDNVTPY